MTDQRHLRLATRASPLARWQAERVAARLGAVGITTSLVVVETEGDRRTDVPLHSIGGQGVFAKEVQAAVVGGRADVAVHSAKDLPVGVGVPGLVLAAVVERGDARDVLVVRAAHGATGGGSRADAQLDLLPTGSLVATGSARRRVQLANLRPDLLFGDLRGNMARRLAMVGTGDVVAVVAAKAAIDRLGWVAPADVTVAVLDPGTMLPQVGQGVLAVECRQDDAAARAALDALDDTRARRAMTAERAYLGTLGGGCTLPVGAYATVPGDEPDGPLTLTGMLASEDGRVVLRYQATGTDPEALGRDVARTLLDQAGGSVLLGADR